MGRYLFRVVLSVGFLACSIWFGLPLLKVYAPEAYNQLVVFFLKDVGIEKKRDTGRVQTSGDDYSTARRSQLASTNSKDGNFESINVNAEENYKIDSDFVQTTDYESKTDANDSLSPLNKDPGYGWGIVVTNSFVYDRDMKRIGIFSGGTVISRKNSELKKNGYVSECFYLKDQKWVEKTVFIYESDIVKFDHPYSETNVEQRDLLIRYCRTLAQYEEKRAELYKKAIRKNPHFDTYKKALEDYNAFFQKANAAKAALDHATGAARTKLMDELRKYRADEPIVVRHFKETKDRYDVWKTEHIGNGTNLKIGSTVEMQSLQNALDVMRPKVQSIVPGL